MSYTLEWVPLSKHDYSGSLLQVNRIVKLMWVNQWQTLENYKQNVPGKNIESYLVF